MSKAMRQTPGLSGRSERQAGEALAMFEAQESASEREVDHGSEHIARARRKEEVEGPGIRLRGCDNERGFGDPDQQIAAGRQR